MPAISKYKGFFLPRNPQKYKGDPRNIVYRSFLELKMMMRLDADPGVLSWSSEESHVPYVSPVDGKQHRYFYDMLMTTKDGTTMVEIKPDKQTRPPKKQSRQTKKYIEEVMTWGVNSAKWEAAREYCGKRGWKFVVMTEHNLGVTYG